MESNTNSSYSYQRKNSDNNDNDSSEEKIIADIERNEGDEILEKENQPKLDNNEEHDEWFTNKELISAGIVVLIILLIFITPWSRYKILGLFVRKNFSIEVVDSKTNLPIPNSNIVIGKFSAKTDAYGKATIQSLIGDNQISIAKSFYQLYKSKVFVPFDQKSRLMIELIPTGRQVKFKVLDKISGLPLSNILVNGEGSLTKTNLAGDAVLVLSPNKISQTINISGKDYKSLTQTVNNTDNKVNVFKIIPSQYVYFLSNSSGTINLDKVQVDGGNLKVVLGGANSESIYDTAINPSNDWTYIAMNAKRNDGNPCLTIINAKNDSSYIVDQTNGTYSLYGWDKDNNLIYSVGNNDLPAGSPGQETLKSYNARTNKTITLDATSSQTNDSLNGTETYSNVYILPNNMIIFTKHWAGDTSNLSNLNLSINSISSNGSNKKTIQTFPQANYLTAINSHLYGINNVTFWIKNINNSSPDYFQYINGQFTDSPSNINVNNILASTSNYSLSPDGQKVAYVNNINNHSAVYLAGSDGNNVKQIALLDKSYTVYGWFTSKYLILNKNGNEFYIMPVSGTINQSNLIKITNHL